MMMEFDQDQVLGSEEHSQFIKGKRTKRQRPASPLSLGITASSSSSAGESGGERERINNNNVLSSSSPSTSVEFAELSSVEEEDMANCLILLAQGNHQNCHISRQPAINVSSARRNITDNYQCKTCNRCFPSFQALGGHRASHKKPKHVYEEKKALTTTEKILQKEEEDRIDIASTNLSLQIPNNRVLCSPPPTNVIKSNKVHECSICGAEFSSGQALGGHMRRHRPFANTTSTTPTTRSPADHRQSHQELKKPRNNLQLDLNLPAPEDHDLRESKFHFPSKDQVLVFTASPLVDCHY